VGAYIYFGPRGPGDHDGSSADIVVTALGLDSDIVAFGDGNGDGITDLAVSHIWETVTVTPNEWGEGPGVVSVFHGPFVPGTTLRFSEADACLEGEHVNDFAGSSVSSAGDQNGDGLDDLLIGAMGTPEGESRWGSVYVAVAPFSGVMPLGEAWARWDMIAPNHGGQTLGDRVRGGRDFTGDGLPDVTFFAADYQHLYSFIYAPGPVPQGVFTLPDGVVTVPLGADFVTSFGVHAVSGDINGDGIEDLSLFQLNHGPLESSLERTFWAGGPTLLDGSPQVRVVAGRGGPKGAGDTNGDGAPDVMASGSTGPGLFLGPGLW
jgi:hypothetical protein